MSQIHEVFAYLCIADAPRAIEYYKEVFDAEEKFRLVEPSGKIGHAELDLGGTTLMIADEYPEMSKGRFRSAARRSRSTSMSTTPTSSSRGPRRRAGK